MKALTFMKQREQAWSYEDSEESLWVREVDDTGELTYAVQFKWRARLIWSQVHQSDHGDIAAQSSSGVKRRFAG